MGLSRNLAWKIERNVRKYYNVIMDFKLTDALNVRIGKQHNRISFIQWPGYV